LSDTFRVAVTAIIHRPDGRVLITKRSPKKRLFPNKWTLPGGGVEYKDFYGEPTAINNQWYNVLEHAVIREVQEETKLLIKNIKYLCNIFTPDCAIISFTADTLDNYDNVELQKEECTEYVWVSSVEAEEYDLIDGILDEIKMADASSN
jgi:8-oxo-dGTP diphosphatase